MAGYTKNSDGGYSVNYDDQRFKDVKTEQAQKEAQTNQIYNNIINSSDQYYDRQIQAAQDYSKRQSELQQAQTDFAIEKIEQQKEQAQKDYVKEQKGSYVDYMRQTKSNEQNMSNQGLSNTGYSESSLVSMYNQYQSRVGTARESLNQAILNYNNSINAAILANNEALAEIAYNALQQQNKLSQQAFEYKNSMILAREQQLQDLNNTYYARYQSVLGQINNEIQLQMTLDQIDRDYEKWTKEFEEDNRRWQLEYDEKKAEWEQEQALKEKEYELQRQQVEASLAASRSRSSGGSSSSSSSSSNPYSSSGVYNTGNQVNTAYYQGDYNSDVKYGTFSNGYQPNNVGGKKLSSTGDTITFNTKTLSGESKTVTQTIWQTPDGTKYYWEGRQNKYIKINNSGSRGGGAGGGR